MDDLVDAGDFESHPPGDAKGFHRDTGEPVLRKGQPAAAALAASVAAYDPALVPKVLTNCEWIAAACSAMA